MISAACRKLIKQALCMKLGESTLISCSCHNLMKIKSGDGERLSATRHPFGSELIDLKPDQNRAVVGGNVGVPPTGKSAGNILITQSRASFTAAWITFFTINKKKLINFLWSTITQMMGLNMWKPLVLVCVTKTPQRPVSVENTGRNYFWAKTKS